MPFGVDVAPGVVATNHQHLFCVRLDPAIDCAEGESWGGGYHQCGSCARASPRCAIPLTHPTPDPACYPTPGGRDLVVTEVNADPIPTGPSNPHGNAFAVTERPLLSVHEAMREAAPFRSRAWKVKNPGVINPITGQVRQGGGVHPREGQSMPG